MSASSAEPQVDLPRPEAGVSPGAVSSGPVVILREADLDCDLSTAIDRVRSDDATRDSRILIIGPQPEAEDALRSSSVIPAMPVSPAQLARLGEAAVLTPIGDQLQRLVVAWEALDAELAAGLEELSEAVGDEPRARLQSRVQRLSSLREWLTETRAALQENAQELASGMRKVVLSDPADDVSRQLMARYPQVRAAFPLAELESFSVLGKSALVAEALFLVASLVAMRIGGQGRVVLQVEHSERWVSLTFHGDGEVHPVDAPDWIRQLHKVVADLGGEIRSAEISALAGMEIRLRRARV